jgi:hypothetical protein
MAVEMDHFDFPTILGHKKVHIPIQWVPVVLGTDDADDTRGFAAHVMKMRQEVIAMQTIDG